MRRKLCFQLGKTAEGGGSLPSKIFWQNVKTGLLNIEIKRGARFDELVHKTAEILARYRRSGSGCPRTPGLEDSSRSCGTLSDEA